MNSRGSKVGTVEIGVKDTSNHEPDDASAHQPDSSDEKSKDSKKISRKL